MKIDESTTFDPSDFRNTVPRFSPTNRKANHAMVELPGRIAGWKQVTPAQVARAWEPWIVPIPGTTTIHRLEENAGTVAVALTAADFCDIHAAASRIEVRGARYSEAAQRMINR